MIVTDNTYGGTFRLFDKVLTRYGLTFSYVDTPISTAVERGDHAADEAAVRRDADQPGDEPHRPRGGRGARASRTARGWPSTTRSPARPAAADRVRRRPGGAQHDEVPQRPQRQRRRHRRRRARGRHRVAAVRAELGGRDPRARSTRGSCCAGPRRWPSAWRSTTRTGWRSPSIWRRTRRCGRSIYPGLPDHPQHALAARQMQGFGGMLAFELGSLEGARRCPRTASGCMALAESLGGVESLISHPATMTHASVPPSGAPRSASPTVSCASRPGSKTSTT